MTIPLNNNIKSSSLKIMSWTALYAPLTSADLCMHKKKVQDLEAVLEDPYTAHEVLVLTGPPGCGKYTTLRLVAEELGFQVCQWMSPCEQVSDSFFSFLTDGIWCIRINMLCMGTRNS